MRRFPTLVLALVLAVAAMGCDSEEELSESEILVGSWTVVEVSDQDGERDRTDVFQQGVDDFSATLRADGTYDLAITYVDPERPPTQLEGTYEVNEGANRLTLFAGPQELPFSYDVESENRIGLGLQAPIVQQVFGTAQGTYEDEVVFTVERVD